jgi:iron complex outermembrane receptor protein
MKMIGRSLLSRASGRRLLLTAASSAIALTLISPAAAQETGPGSPATGADQTEATNQEIIVTGIRGSLQRNLDIKRDAPGVVDAISAEDIGKFPDSNVAASLQRLPGVSIQRSGVRGEPTGVTVRGFGGDFNETLYDGRHISTASGNRAVDFSTIGADFVGQLAVYKTPDVSISAGAIGATIDISYPKPFDRPGFHIAATGSGSYQSRSKDFVPTGGLLVSNTFANDTLGVLADVVYRRQDTDTNRVFVSGWPGGKYAPCQLAGSTAASCAPTSDVTAPASQQQTIVGWFEQQAGAEQSRAQDERIDARIALQWHPSADIMLTLDDNFSRQKVRTETFGYAAWFNQSDLRNVKLDSNGTTLDFNQFGSPMDLNASVTQSILQTNQLGANLKWDITGNLKLDLDGAISKSWLNPNGEFTNDSADIGYGGTNAGGTTILGANTGITINGPSDNFLPVFHDIGPAGNAARFLDPTAIGSHVMVRQADKNTDLVKQFRATGSWSQENFNIKFGGSYLEDKFNFQSSSTFRNNFWQAFAGYGAPSGRTTGITLPSSVYQGTISTSNFIPGYSGSLAPGILQYNPYAVYNYLQGLGNPQTQTVPGYNPDCCTNPAYPYTGTLNVALDPGSIRQVQEKTWALFVRANFDVDIGNMPFHFNAGIRDENTNLASTAIGQTYTALTRSPADPTLITAVPGATSAITAKSSYNFLLPSVDMKLELTPKLHLRFDASRTLTRPGLTNLNPVLNLGGLRVGALTATGGNPDLKPYLSDNFDAAVEWYYQRNSYIAVDFFLKHVTNFIVGGVSRQNFQGLVDPSTSTLAVFNVTSQVNGPEATVRGVEIAAQHVFGDSGFGFNANATFVDTNKPYDPKDISQTGFAVTGLANSANFVGFFDKYGFQARIAANWRDKYLLQFGQNQNTGAYGAEPTFVNKQISIDFSTSYDVTKNATVFFEGTNLNNSTYSTHGRFDNQLLDAFSYGRRFVGGVRIHY